MYEHALCPWGKEVMAAYSGQLFLLFVASSGSSLATGTSSPIPTWTAVRAVLSRTIVK